MSEKNKILDLINSIKNVQGNQLRSLPWRKTADPYKVLVSEIMLQQTQVSRVIPKYLAWLELFPDWFTLANVPTDQVLSTWQGLGYNRRALNIQRTAKIITENHQGLFPTDKKLVLNLPGIGEYTAGAVLTFAFNQQQILLETNIRTVLLYHLYDYQNLIKKVTDKELAVKLQLVMETAKIRDYRSWYWAMMDYGVQLKQTVGNLNRLSSTHTKQSKFTGSWRQKRSLLLKLLLIKPLSTNAIGLSLKITQKERNKLITDLVKEGFIQPDKLDSNRYTIVTNV